MSGWTHSEPLSIVATPIGNLEDVTYRAIRTLRECDVIAAEDTRRTAKLLARYEIRKPLVSLREQNEARESPRLVERVLAGEHVAYVTDAGTPGIADPGARLVRLARERGAHIEPIPGPSAVAAALSVAGVDASQFVFLGFPPSSGRARAEWMAVVSSESRPVVLFEAPHRILRTASELLSLVNRPFMLFRELTKVHADLVICSKQSDVNIIRPEGEFTVVIPPAPHEPADKTRPEPREDAILDVYRAFSQIDRDKTWQFETIATLTGLTTAQVKKIVKSKLYIG